MNIKFLALIVLLSCKGLYAQKNTAKPKNTWLTYNDSDFTLSFPRYLEVEFNGAPGTRIILVSKLESENDSFRDNINLIAEVNNNPDVRLEHYITLSEARLKQLINEFKLIESTKTTLNGMDCYKMVYTGKQGKYTIQWEQYYFLQNNRAFILTLTSEAGSFTHFVQLFEKIASTITIK